jgi:hypothetical protein
MLRGPTIHQENYNGTHLLVHRKEIKFFASGYNHPQRCCPEAFAILQATKELLKIICQRLTLIENNNEDVYLKVPPARKEHQK